MVLLMDCMAAMPCGGWSRARALITVFEKMKKTPAISPQPSADKRVNVKNRFSIILHKNSNKLDLYPFILNAALLLNILRIDLLHRRTTINYLEQLKNYRISSTANSLRPPGVFTETSSSNCLPSSALPIGEVIEIMPFSGSVSSGPTS